MSTKTASTETVTAATKDHRTLCELTCDLTVVDHRLRDLRRFTTEGAAFHLDAALTSVGAALDSLHAEHITHDRAAPHVNDLALTEVTS